MCRRNSSLGPMGNENNLNSGKMRPNLPTGSRTIKESHQPSKKPAPGTTPKPPKGGTSAQYGTPHPK